MLNEGNLPKLYWAEAVNTSVHLMNMSPTEALTRLTPEEAYSGIKPNVSTLKVFGCVAYMHVPDENRRKLDVKSKRCVFTSYDMYSKGYRLVNPDTNKIHISRDVIFDESDKWFKNTSSSYEEVSMEDVYPSSYEKWELVDCIISLFFVVHAYIGSLQYSGRTSKSLGDEDIFFYEYFYQLWERNKEGTLVKVPLPLIGIRVWQMKTYSSMNTSTSFGEEIRKAHW
ncbi:hypothetical protein L7F22_022759 [Adiantum nelumboides]|nr:hypothetical protein [Adiantum nelumboides]